MKSWFGLLALAFVAMLLGCGDAAVSSTSANVPGSRAYDGASCVDESEPGRVCANPTDRCPSGGFYPSRMACRSGTWRCLRDPVGSCSVSMTPPDMPTCTNEGARGTSCDLGLCPDGSRVQAHRVCMSGRYICQPDLPVCASTTPRDSGTTTDASVEYNGPCQPGETRHCYSGPMDSEGIGQCRGATRSCVVNERTRTTQWSPDCVGEVTPNPVETPYDGIDNNCNGWIDDDQRLHAGRVWNCVANSGCYWFGNAPDNAWSPVYGFQGCYTSGRFLPLVGAIRPGMLVSTGASNELHRVYYIGRDMRRHIFPTSTTLATWFLEPGGTGNVHLDAQACRRVVQVPLEMLAALPIGGNVTMRPGTVITGITTDPARYVLSRGGVLRRLEPTTLGVFLAPDWLMHREALLPDAFFVNYSVGRSITDSNQYDGRREYAVTLDQDLGLVP